MQKMNLLVLFGGVSPEHEVSLRSAESVLHHLDLEQFRVIPVGITKQGQWLFFGSDDYTLLPTGAWENHPSCCRAILSPVHGEGLLLFENDNIRQERIDVIFPVLHGENGEDGSIQGLAQLASIPCVGPSIAASASAMDKSLTKLIADHAQVRQAAWVLVTAAELAHNEDDIIERIEEQFRYPVFVKPAGTGSSVGVGKAGSEDALRIALREAAKYDHKILVEEFIDGREIEVAVLGNEEPIASVCGEIDAGAEFYDYEAKYISDSAQLYVPARLEADVAERVRRSAVKIYSALGCTGLSRVDFFVTARQDVIFNEINTLPGFTSISMYPKLFEASGIPYQQLLTRLVAYAVEAHHG